MHAGDLDPLSGQTTQHGQDRLHVADAGRGVKKAERDSASFQVSTCRCQNACPTDASATVWCAGFIVLQQLKHGRMCHQGSMTHVSAWFTSEDTNGRLGDALARAASESFLTFTARGSNEISFCSCDSPSSTCWLHLSSRKRWSLRNARTWRLGQLPRGRTRRTRVIGWLAGRYA